MKKISLLALLLGVLLLLSSCGGLPETATDLTDKMKDEGYKTSKEVGEDRITYYVEEYGLDAKDVTDIIHIQKENNKTNDVKLTMGTFLFCQDESTAISLKTAIEKSLTEQFGAVNNPNYHNFTVKQKDLIVFFGTQSIWEVAND